MALLFALDFLRGAGWNLLDGNGATVLFLHVVRQRVGDLTDFVVFLLPLALRVIVLRRRLEVVRVDLAALADAS